MNKNNRTDSSKYEFALALFIYAIAGVLLLKYYRYWINPDGISYISLAQKYLAGNFHDVINGWWGPAISWLLAPLLFLKIEPLLASKILNLIIGAQAIFIIWMFSRKFFSSAGITRAISFALIPVILSFSMSDIAPDLLLMCLLLIYLYFIFKPNYATMDLKNGWW